MADDEKAGENTSTRGNDWEVVSLTASAYAAAPGPNAFYLPVESKDEINKEVHVDSAAMFMSNHFIFPPCEHKQLLIDPDCSEIYYEPASQDLNPTKEFSGALNSSDDNWKLKSVDGLNGIQLFDEGENLSDHGMKFGESKVLEELTMTGKEPDMYVKATFSSFHAKSDISQSIICDGEESDHPVSNLSYHNPEYLLDCTNAAKLNEENKVDGTESPDLPCQAWWKKRAMSVYNHAKEANTFWSVFVAAAVMGFVILGHQWQREKSQLQQLKWLTASDESLRRVLGPFSRFKDILVRGHQQHLLIRGGVASTH